MEMDFAISLNLIIIYGLYSCSLVTLLFYKGSLKSYQITQRFFKNSAIFQKIVV